MRGEETHPALTGAVLTALRAMRPPFALYEADLHALVAQRLQDSGLPGMHEVPLGGGCRIDFLVDTVGVEIKKGKPCASKLCAQLTRYAQSEQIAALVVVSWQSVTLPARIGGKPVHTLSLCRLWGVSLP